MELFKFQSSRVNLEISNISNACRYGILLMWNISNLYIYTYRFRDIWKKKKKEEKFNSNKNQIK